MASSLSNARPLSLSARMTFGRCTSSTAKWEPGLSQVLGEGSYGNVFRAKHRETGEVRAVKVISKAKIKNKDRFKMEIDILKKLDHPNVIKLYETFEDHKYVYLVMEICTGGELFDRIKEAGCFTEKFAARVFKQILQALFYCHKNKICHR